MMLIIVIYSLIPIHTSWRKLKHAPFVCTTCEWMANDGWEKLVTIGARRGWLGRRKMIFCFITLKIFFYLILTITKIWWIIIIDWGMVGCPWVQLQSINPLDELVSLIGPYNHKCEKKKNSRIVKIGPT